MLGVAAGGPLGGSGDSATEAGSGAGSVAAPSISEREALAVLVTVDGLGPMTLGRMLAAFGSATAVIHAAQRGAVRDLAAAAASDARQAPSALPAAIVVAGRDAEAITARIRRARVDTVTLEDADYPARLRAIALPPHLLFVRGDRRALAMPHAVAVVGTRRPSDAGRRVAGAIAGAIARSGAAVVSGLAVGIDGAAHSATLTEGGVTVAVLGGGHERLFPASHRRLADTIVAAGGAVVSELEPDAEPTRGTFPRRNRILSGLADATVVVEAGARSGALLTAGWALEQGRECYLVPGPIDRPTSAGCLSFLREAHGAARIVAGIPQLIEDLNLAPPPRPGQTTDRAALLTLPPVAAEVAAAILAGHATTDELVAVTRMPVATVLAALTVLEARGLVVDVYGRHRPAGHLASNPPASRR
jgi:DNA processing protein